MVPSHDDDPGLLFLLRRIKLRSDLQSTPHSESPLPPFHQLLRPGISLFLPAAIAVRSRMVPVVGVVVVVGGGGGGEMYFLRT